jgi:NAD(P)-dependent dehydrogenase (short-subunit alcohol dehydrogenase family)
LALAAGQSGVSERTLYRWLSENEAFRAEYRALRRETVNNATYQLQKARINAVARETGRHGLRLNVVCPGLIVPPREESISPESMWNQMREIFTDEVLERVERNYILRRMGTAKEIANAVVFLASDAASFITDQTLSVSGGYTMM